MEKKNVITSCFWGPTHNRIYVSVSSPAKEHSVAGKSVPLLFFVSDAKRSSTQLFVLSGRPYAIRSHILDSSDLQWVAKGEQVIAELVKILSCRQAHQDQIASASRLHCKTRGLLSVVSPVPVSWQTKDLTYWKQGRAQLWYRWPLGFCTHSQRKRALVNMDLRKTLFQITLLFFKWKIPDCHWELPLVWMTVLTNVDHPIAAGPICDKTKYILPEAMSKNHLFVSRFPEWQK